MCTKKGVSKKNSPKRCTEKSIKVYQKSIKVYQKKYISVYCLRRPLPLNIGLVQYSNGRFVSGYQKVRYLNGGLEIGLKKNLFMIQNVRYSKGPPNHVTFPFEYWTPVLSSIQMNSGI